VFVCVHMNRAQFTLFVSILIHCFHAILLPNILLLLGNEFVSCNCNAHYIYSPSNPSISPLLSVCLCVCVNVCAAAAVHACVCAAV
jgi:hypothetical protein